MLAVVAVGLRLAESGLARLVARTVPVGRLRRSLLALLTVLAYVLVSGWRSLRPGTGWKIDGHWGTQSARLAESAVGFGMFLAFVLGLGRALLANGRSSWRLPPIADDMALELAPLPWLFAFVALVVWLPITLNEVLETPLNGVVSYLAPTVAFAIACVVGLYLLRHPARKPPGEAQAQDAAEAPDLASDNRCASAC